MTTRRYTISVLIKTLGSKKAKQELSEMGGVAGKAAKGIDLLQVGIAGLGAAGVIGGAILAKKAITGIATELLEYGRATETLKARLKTVEGSQAAANARFEELAQFAAKTPFQLEGVTNAYIRLQNVGIEASEKRMRAFGDTAAANGRSLEEYTAAVASATVGEMDALKSYGILAKQEGDKVTFTFKGMKTEVGRNSEEIVRYLEQLGETNFAGGMADQASTVNGMISSIEDNWGILVSAVYESGFDDIVKGVLSGVSQGLDYLLQRTDLIQSAFVEGFTLMGRGVLRFGELYAEVQSSISSGFSSFLGLIARVKPEFRDLADRAEKASQKYDVAAAKLKGWRLELEGWRARKLVQIFTDQADGAKDVEDNATGAAAAVKELGDEVVRLAQQDPNLERVAQRISEIYDLVASPPPSDLENAFFSLQGAEGAAIREQLGEEEYNRLFERVSQKFQEEMREAYGTSADELRKELADSVEYIGDETEDALKGAIDESGDYWRRSWGDVVAQLSGAIQGMLSEASGEVQALASILGEVAQGYSDYKANGGTDGFGDWMSSGSGGGGWGSIVGAIGSYYTTDTFAGGGMGKYGGQLSGTYAEEGAAIGGAFGGVWGFYGAAIGTFIKKGADEATARLAGMGTDDFFSEISADTPGLEQTIAGLTAAINGAFSDAIKTAGGRVLSSPEIELKIRDDLITVFVAGMEYQAAGIEDAIYFALTTAFNESTIEGVAPEVLQAMTSRLRRTGEEWVQDVQMVQGIIDYNLGETTVSARTLGRQLEELRKRWTELGIDQSEFVKFAAGQWQEYRNRQLGIEQSFEDQMRQRQQQFNAERARQLEEFERQIAETLAAITEASADQELIDLMRENGFEVGEVAGLLGEELHRAATVIRDAIGVGNSGLEDLLRQLDALQGAVEAMPDAISDEEVEEAIKNKNRGGGSGRKKEIEDWRKAVAELGVTLGPVAQQIQSTADAYDREIERGRKLRQAIDDLVAAREAELEVIRADALDAFIKDWTVWFHSFGPVEQAMMRFGDEADAMHERLEDLYEAGVLTEEQFRALSEAVGPEAWRKAAVFAQDFTNGLLLELYGYLGDEEAAAELRWTLTVAELEAKRAQLAIALEQKYITQEMYDHVSDLIDDVIAAGPAAGGGGGGGDSTDLAALVEEHGRWVSREDRGGGRYYYKFEDGFGILIDEGGGGSSGSGSSGTSTAARQRDSYRNELDRAAAGNFGSIDELRTTFQDLYDRMLVPLSEWQSALDQAVDAFRDRLLEPVRALRDEILGEDGPGLSEKARYEYALAEYQRVAAGVAAGDASVLSEVRDVGSAYLEAAAGNFGNTALGRIEAQVLALLGQAENVELTGSVVDGQVVINGSAPTGGGPVGTSTFVAGVDALQNAYRRVGDEQLESLEGLREEVRGLRADVQALLSIIELGRAS